MLAWVLPYLVLSLSNGGIHNHPLTQVRPGLTNDGMGGSQEAYQTAPAARPHSESGCAACQWLTHCNGYLAPLSPVPVLTPFCEAPPSLVAQPFTITPLRNHIRAPPCA